MLDRLSTHRPDREGVDAERIRGLATRPVALAAVMLLCVGASACGGASSKSGSSSSASTAVATTAAIRDYSNFRRVDADRDNDVEAADDDTNNNEVLEYGHPPSASDRRSIESLVRRYYAVALARDGITACSLLYSTFAEAVPEDYGQSPPGQPYMTGKTCPIALTKFFTYLHTQLALEVPRLRVISVTLEHNHGVAVLEFGPLPERQIPVIREGHTWRVNALLDAELR